MKFHLSRLLLLSALVYFGGCKKDATKSSSTKEAATGDLVKKAVPCQFNGAQVPHGGSVTASQNSSVSYGGNCTSETRTCDKGVLSGSFQFASCSVGTPASCLFNGMTLSHGTIVSAWQNSSVPFGASCVSQQRSCQDGVLSESYSYAACNVGTPASCVFNGQSIAHGASVSAAESSSVPFTSTCMLETRTCDDGALSGSYLFASCGVGAPASCLFNGQSIAHGSTVSAAQSSTVAFGENCVTEKRTCNNGVLTGTYEYAGCTVGAPASCLLNGNTIAHGAYALTYSAASTYWNRLCEYEHRWCTNGALSGSFAFDSCIKRPECSDGTAPVNGQCLKITKTTLNFSMPKRLSQHVYNSDNEAYFVCKEEAPNTESALTNFRQHTSMACGNALSQFRDNRWQVYNCKSINCLSEPNTASCIDQLTCEYEKRESF